MEENENEAPENTDFDKQVKLAKDVITYTLYEDDVGDQVLQLISDAKNPATGVGKAIIMVVAPIVEAMMKKQPDLDPAIWMSDDGVLDEIIEEIMDMAHAAGIDLTEEDAAKAKAVVFQDVQAMVEAPAQDGGDPMAAEGVAPSAPQPAPLMQRGAV